jgi:MYXO-CTERM domain-containing protein
MKASLRRSVATLVGSVALLVAPAAFAVGEPCFNDDDCPGGGLACGGDICNWTMSHPMAADNPDKPYTCVLAGSGTKGSEGWCTDNTDCKCGSVGATCRAPYCTFTKASDAPAGGGSGAGGSDTAGTPPVTAGTATAGTTATAPPAEEGGCSVGAVGSTSTGAALGLGIAGLALALLRRRR